MAMKPSDNQRLFAFSLSFGITFLAMIVVLGSICLVSYTRAGLAVTGQEKPSSLPNTYLPTAEDRLVLLLAAAEDLSSPPDTFLLLGFLPDKGKIALCVLPPITYLEYGGQGTTLQRLYQQGGLAYAQKALAQYLDLPISRRALLTVEALDALMAFPGLLSYDLPVDLDYPLRGRRIVMPRGHYQLDARRIMDITAYPAYPGGERERSDRSALLIARLVEECLPLFLEPEGERLRSTALSVLETDLSAADCLARSQALEFLAKLDLPATTCVFLEGSLSRSYTVYHLTPACISRIRDMFQSPGQAAEDRPLPAREPVPGLEKPDPSSQSAASRRDSGAPPIQEQQPLESPFVRFR